MLRVLLIATGYTGGGAERSARELFELLRARGCEAEMIVAPKRDDYPPHVHGVRNQWERYVKALPGALVWDRRHIGSGRALNAIAAVDYDIVHGHNLFGGWLNFGALKRLAERVPFVWTFHDEQPLNLSCSYDLSRVMSSAQIEQRFGIQLPKLDCTHREAQRAAARLATALPRPAAIICPSTYLAEAARRSPHYKDVPVHLLPYGLPFVNVPETQMPRDQARRELSLPVDKPIVFVVAAQLSSPFKGMWLGIEALKQLRTQGHVLIAGGGADEIARQISLPSTSLGFVKGDAQLARAYRAADVTMLPSIAENFPYVALESFACETPIAAFPIGGFPDLVGDNERGMLADSVTAAALAHAVDALLSDEGARNGAGNAAHEWLLRTCDQTRWIDRHIEIYDDSIARFALRGSAVTC
jgi:glycosyltransferase involved in cell wall biosynthesis